MLKISVIIPCYNDSETIEECIDSFKKQTLPPKEIIVVNDASTDNSLEIVRKCNVIVLNNNKNKGPSFSRNRGAKRASGEFLVFAEGDGKYSENYLEKIIEPLKDKSVGGVLSGRRILWTSKKSLFVKYQNLKWEVVDNLMSLGKREIIGAWAFRKKVFEEIGGYDERYREGEDVDLVDRLKKREYKILWVPGTFFFHKDPDTFREMIEDKLKRRKIRKRPKKVSRISFASKMRMYLWTLFLSLKKGNALLFFYSLFFPFVFNIIYVFYVLKDSVTHYFMASS